MISISPNKIYSLFEIFHSRIDTLITESFQNLQSFRTNPDKSGGRGKPRISMVLKAKEIEYLDYLICHFQNIVIASPNEIITFKSHFDSIISGKQIFEKHKEFKNELINRLGYSKFRDEFYPEYFLKTDLKACAYCNSQLAVSVRTIKGEKIAKFQVDHFLPKSEYPGFSISFFNLIPVCGPCNGKKSSTSINFNFYSNNQKDLKKSPFQFELDRKSIAKYRINGNIDELIIKFIDLENRRFDEQFDIEGIYNTQKDIAEELILKSMIYNQKYLEGLRYSFKKLYRDKIPMVERLLVGNYTNEKDIHKRPMSKFTMDLARQLKLI
jgi:hypothetical protein